MNWIRMPSFPKGDDIFCALGTTIKVAGSKEAFYKVDFAKRGPYELAKRALKEGANRYFVVSAMGANMKSRYFYNRVKGDRRQVSFLDYRTHIFKPSLLRGDRKENRPNEKFAQGITRIILFIGPGRNTAQFMPIKWQMLLLKSLNKKTKVATSMSLS